MINSWNNLPNETVNLDNIKAFKNYVKKLSLPAYAGGQGA